MLALIFILYVGIGIAVVLFIVSVLRDYETYENVEMPSSFELAIATWPYRVWLCLEAAGEANSTDESNDLKKNPLD